MPEFDGAADAGSALAQLLRPGAGGACLVGVIPNGVPVAIEAARLLDLPLLGVVVERSTEGIEEVRLPAGLDVSAPVIVVDDGVETGAVAVALGRALREARVERLLLAVPVCPRESSARLRPLYDEVVAVVRPLARRSLDWHYRERPQLTRSDAEKLLADYTTASGGPSG